MADDIVRLNIHLLSLGETEELAARLAAHLHPGDVLCLWGDLGVGKTTFTRALVAALDSPALVSSPTFTLIHEYAGGRITVYHADAYRLQGVDELAEVGLEEYLSRGDGLTVIEWPERIKAALPPERLDLSLETGDGEEERIVTFTPHGLRWSAWASAWSRAMGPPPC